VLPFKCGKSGQEFLPENGGKCGLCDRLLISSYLYENLYPQQRYPICVDCLQKIKKLIFTKKISDKIDNAQELKL
jgi:hypothetical protein